MNTIRGSIEKHINRSPYLRDALAEGIINVSSLARWLHRDVEADLRKEVSVDAVFMALKRFAAALPVAVDSGVDKAGAIGDIALRAGLVQLTLAGSDRLQSTLAQAMNHARSSSTDFYAMTKALHETTITASAGLADVIEPWLENERVTARRDELTALALQRKSSDLTRAVRALELPLRQLSWNGVAAVDVISTTHELIVIVQDSDVGVAVEVLRAANAVRSPRKEAAS